MELPAIATREQMANILQVSERKLDKMASEKLIPQMRLGTRSPRYVPAEVLAALKANPTPSH